MQKKVSVVKYEKPIESVAKAIELSGALDHLKSGDRVFIKPNIVFWSRKTQLPPWGVITTSRVMEDFIRQLKDRGAGQIIIGEGITLDDPNDTKTAADAFEKLGYNKLARLYGVKVVDNLRQEFRQMDLGDGVKLNFSANLLDSDFVASLPVLKTHAQTMVSLSQKNLKGCLDIASRKLCHSDNMEQDLDYHLAKLTSILPRSCALIDGIYTLELGPGYTGQARRSDILIASRDLLAADLVGTAALGLDPAQVPYLNKICKIKKCSSSLEEIEIQGESIDKVTHPHAWDFPYNKDGTLPLNLEQKGIKGLLFPKYDHSLCTYCSGLNGPVQMAIMKAWDKEPFNNVEILTGKLRSPTPGMEHTILIGKCQVKLNKNNPAIKNPLLVPGCPPNLDKLKTALNKSGIKVKASFFDRMDSLPSIFMRKYARRPEFSMDFFQVK